MYATKLVKLFFKIFLLKEKPEVLPYSKVLLFLLLVIVFIEKNIANVSFVHVLQNYAPEKVDLTPLSFWNSSIVIGVSILIMWACISGILAFYKVSERLIQVMSAIVGIDIILTGLFMVWMLVLYFAPAPLPVNSLLAWGLVLTFILLLYWQFMAYIHVFANSVSISILKAGLFSLLYMLLQHNIAEWLMELIL